MDKNGEAMLDFIDKNYLILLNGHAECLGEMHIDDGREEVDLSNHNLLIA